MPDDGGNGAGKVNINQASEEDLARLSEVGGERARRIIEFRCERGDFSCVDDLEEVPGFGKRRVEALKGSLKV